LLVLILPEAGAMRVLLVEDDVMIGEGLTAALGAEGMSVDWIRDGATAEAALRVDGFAVVLLDLGLPGAEGLDLLKSARREGVETPILIITARGGLEDRVSGLDFGADDYLLKPFEMRELLARIRALIRRRAGRATSTLVAGDVELDAETHELRHGGATGVLSAREYAVMHALIERPGRILSRSQIEERIYGWGEEVESNAVDVVIHSIRRKFGKSVILNVRGAGWLLPKS
jgi:two-component system, OmpR family, response regulator